jgi:hypothetical protein
MHFYSSDSDSWRIRSAQNTISLEFSTNADVYRGRVYATNSNEIGFLSQDSGWSIRTTNSVVDAYHDFYAPIFYDRDNSARFVNPNGTSQVDRLDINAQSYMRTQKAWVATDHGHGVYGVYSASRYQHVWSMGTAYNLPANGSDTSGAAGNLYGLAWSYNPGYGGANNNIQGKSGLNHQLLLMMNGTTYFAAGNGMWTSGIATSTNSFRAPIFYDTNNTARYADPASTSQMGTIEWDQLNARDRGDFITFYGDNSQNHSISSRNASGGTDDDIRINSYGSVYINLDSNNNNTSGADFFIGRHGQATGTMATTDLFRVYGDANYAYSAFSFRAPIFYDSNNTGYYCDPSNASNFNAYVRANEFYARNWFRNDNSNEGNYNQATGVHAFSGQGQHYSVGGNSSGSSMSLTLFSSHSTNRRMWIHGGSDGYWGFLNSGGQWQLRSRYGDGYSPNLQFREEGNESWTGNPGNDVGKIEYHSNRFYIAAGGNSNRICQFRRDGSDKSYVDNNGLYVGTATSARWADLAERYSADEIYPNATVLGINLDGDSEATLWQPGMPLLGVISTNPAVQMNDMGIEPGSNSIKAQMNPFIALKGRIPCLVSQPVKKGQWVIPDADGKAKGVDYGTVGINSYEIIGIALSDSENGEVEVKV